jgi:hypothetical protein
LPGFAEQVVERIEYGGMLLGRRQAACQGASTLFRSYLGNLFSVADAADAAEQNEADVVDNDDVETPEVPDGWRIVTHGLTLHKIPGGEEAAFDRRTKSLSKHSKFTQEQIKQLLGPLSAQALDNVPLQNIDESTLIFGESAPTYSWSQHQSDLSNSARVPNAPGDIVEGIPVGLVGGWSQNRLAQAPAQSASSSGGAAAGQAAVSPAKNDNLNKTLGTGRAEKARELLAQIRLLSEDNQANSNNQNLEIPPEAISESVEPTKPTAMLINSVPTLSLLKRRGLGDIRML